MKNSVKNFIRNISKKQIICIIASIILICLILLITICSNNNSQTPEPESDSSSAVTKENIWNDKTLPYKDQYRENDGQIVFVMNASPLLDGNYNETLFSGVQQYAFAAENTYSYYKSPTNSIADTTDTLNQAIEGENCRLVVVTGSNFNVALGSAMSEHPEISFLLIGGHPQNEKGENIPLASNVHCITFHEEEAGYLAGYLSVLDGYRSFGFIGGEDSKAVVSYGSGFLQGIDDAAYDAGCISDIQVRYWYSGVYKPADEIYDKASSWYADGCQIIFACGGSLYESVLLAAEESGQKMIGVDVNQNTLSENVLTSAMIGLDHAVVIALDDFFAHRTWSDSFAGATSAYGVSEFCATLPMDPWRFQNVTLDDYATLINQLRNGDATVSTAPPAELQLKVNVNFYESGLAGNSASEDPVWSHSWTESAQQTSSDSSSQEHLSATKRKDGDFQYEQAESLSYGSDASALIVTEPNTQKSEVVFTLKFAEIPSSDDTNIYLFARESHEDMDLLSGTPVATEKKGHTMEFHLPYDDNALNLQYIPALLVDGIYEPVSHGKHITNPEVLATNTTPYPSIPTKKGLLIDPDMFGTEKTTGLNLSRAIYNIPLSLILGESSIPDIPTIEYEYKGKVYKFNSAYVNMYDTIFTLTTNAGLYMTAIVLNDWNDSYPELIHPLSRKRTDSSLYYAFNTTDIDGITAQEAVFNFLAERYTSGEHGMVYDWVLANEINQNRVWNYMDTSDIDYYAESFEDSLRIFYNAVKSHYSSAKIYFSLDHDWNDNDGDDTNFFNGRDLLYKINEYASQGGNYDWGISIHPYPDPLTKVNYWKAEYDMSENAPVLTIMNLTALTDILDKEEFRQRDGSVRSAAITELGFSSFYGENLQAAAFAYCYLIVDNNPYIESFQMNRQTDSILEMKSKLALGIYNADGTPKLLRDIYANIDSAGENDKPDLTFMLNILGADSIEEALSWARP